MKPGLPIPLVAAALVAVSIACTPKEDSAAPKEDSGTPKERSGGSVSVFRFSEDGSPTNNDRGARPLSAAIPSDAA